MISLKLLLKVDVQLTEAKSKTNNNNVVLGGLALIIMIGDFYQFLLRVGRFLWNKPITRNKNHSKSI